MDNNERVIFDCTNTSRVFNGPTSLTIFTISKPTQLASLHNYHFNNGSGDTPGTIGIKDQNNVTYGPWQTIGGVSDFQSVQNAWWIATPNIVIPPGTYTVIDSNPSTWSCNSESNNRGFSYITSIELGPTALTATPGDDQVTLNWDAVTGATGYNVKRSTTAGGPYETIATAVSGTSYVDTNVVNGTTYYYVVTAINADDESANSNETSATPQAAPVEEGQGLLRVTMIDSSEREYQLSNTEINGFVNWHQNHSSADTSSYMLNKKIGLQSSKDYLAFEKIISFEVIPLPVE